ncbi:MAG TPA: shikimate kinase, partial [Mangrovimonas sp.]|nr:shikimate kinase [Mangrovimonas sp.]
KVLTQHQNTKTIYLKMSIEQLSKRLLQEKDTRPLIAHLKSDDELNEFIGKHLFERQYYYNQASIILDVNGNSVQEIVEKIVLNLV